MTTNISVGDVVVASLNRVFKKLPEVITVALLPAMVFFGVVLFGMLIGRLAHSQFLFSLAWIIGDVVLGFFALAWIRVVLKGYQGNASRAKFSLAPADQKFWMYYGVLLVPVILLSIISGLLQGSAIASIIILLFLGLVVVGLYTTVQLVFPAAALGEPTGFDRAWQQGMNALGPMLGINVILALIFAIPFNLINYGLIELAGQMFVAMGESGVIVVLIIMAIIFTPMYFIGMALMATAVSLVYQRLGLGASAS